MADLDANVRIVGAEITRSRRLLDMFNAGTRNRIIRDSMTYAGEKWRAQYVPMRFTAYVRRAPFSYKLTQGAAWKRMQAKGGVFERMAARFDGSNPFPGEGGARIFFGQAYKKWLADQQAQGRYRFSVTGNWNGAKDEYRAWLKAKFRDAFKNWYTDNAKDATPLVLSGTLAKSVMTGRVTSRATSNMAMCEVTMPRAGRQNPWARRILQTVPIAETKQFAAWFVDQVTRDNESATLALVRARAAAARARILLKADKINAKMEASAKKAAQRAADAPFRKARAKAQRRIREAERLEGMDEAYVKRLMAKRQRSTGTRKQRSAA